MLRYQNLQKIRKFPKIVSTWLNTKFIKVILWVHVSTPNNVAGKLIDRMLLNNKMLFFMFQLLSRSNEIWRQAQFERVAISMFKSVWLAIKSMNNKSDSCVGSIINKAWRIREIRALSLVVIFILLLTWISRSVCVYLD